jgi:hypothetical protein
LKKYSARFKDNTLLVHSEDGSEIGMISSHQKIIAWKYFMSCNGKKYDINFIGFLWNEIEITDGGKVLYYTDQNRIIRSGENTKIYTYKHGRTDRLFDRGKVVMEIKTHKKWFKEPVFTVESDDSVDDILGILFLYSCKRE